MAVGSMKAEQMGGERGLVEDHGRVMAGSGRVRGMAEGKEPKDRRRGKGEGRGIGSITTGIQPFNVFFSHTACTNTSTNKHNK